jgi:hypothetical protein
MLHSLNKPQTHYHNTEFIIYHNQHEPNRNQQYKIQLSVREDHQNSDQSCPLDSSNPQSLLPGIRKRKQWKLCYFTGFQQLHWTRVFNCRAVGDQQWLYFRIGDFRHDLDV